MNVKKGSPVDKLPAHAILQEELIQHPFDLSGKFDILRRRCIEHRHRIDSGRVKTGHWCNRAWKKTTVGVKKRVELEMNETRRA